MLSVLDDSLVTPRSVLQVSRNTALRCIPGCSYGGHQGNIEMVKCCICMKWVHPICCGDPEDDSVRSGIYNCSLCRKFPDRLLNIENQLKSCQELNKSLFELVQQCKEECVNLRCLVSKLTTGESNSSVVHCVTENNTISVPKDRLESFSAKMPILPDKLIVTLPDQCKENPDYEGSTWSVTPPGPKTRPLKDLYKSPQLTNSQDGISLQNRFSPLDDPTVSSIQKVSTVAAQRTKNKDTVVEGYCYFWHKKPPAGGFWGGFGLCRGCRGCRSDMVALVAPGE